MSDLNANQSHIVHVEAAEKLSDTNIVDTKHPSNLNQAEISAMKLARTHKLIICTLGIFVCYFYFGILQEKITRGDYVQGDKKDKFICTLSLVFFQCVVNALFAKIILMTVMPQGRDTTQAKYYAASSFTYITAMITSNMALRHVNYPTQVVGKSCKPIPVMILGVLIGRKRYSLRKYMFVLMIVIGVALFIFKEGKASSSSSAAMLGMGEILLIISLSMDGFTGAIQDRMRAEHQSKSGHMMLQMNLWSILFSGIAIVATGEGLEFVEFVKKYPYVMVWILEFSVTSALGQFFIFMSVANFGPLLCSIQTTTRKFFTVLGSVLIFGNTLSERQWIGTALVFTGLILDSIYGKTSK